MNERPPTAYRAAVLFTIFAAACSDSPVAPRHKPSQPAATASSQAGVQTFSGRLADSVVHAFDAVWARGGYADYREARRAWHKANGIPDSVGDPRFAPVPLAPNALIAINDGSYRPTQILSHYEALHFGHTDQYTNVPDGVEAEVTFVGDQAEIAVSSLTITKKGGASSGFSGLITRGAGTVINCADVTLGNCSGQRRLNGVVTLANAPTCDASGSGTVSYAVSNLNASLGITGSAGSSTANASAMGSISSTAAPCPQSSDSAVSVPTAGGAPPGPPPPIPPYNPPPPVVVGTGIYFHCEEGDLYQDGVLIESVLTCYPDT